MTERPVYRYSNGNTKRREEAVNTAWCLLLQQVQRTYSPDVSLDFLQKQFFAVVSQRDPSGFTVDFFTKGVNYDRTRELALPKQ